MQTSFCSVRKKSAPREKWRDSYAKGGLFFAADDINREHVNYVPQLC